MMMTGELLLTSLISLRHLKTAARCSGRNEKRWLDVVRSTFLSKRKCKKEGLNVGLRGGSSTLMSGDWSLYEAWFVRIFPIQKETEIRCFVLFRFLSRSLFFSMRQKESSGFGSLVGRAFHCTSCKFCYILVCFVSQRLHLQKYEEIHMFWDF